MNNLLISLSDTHYKANETPEDQGVVINAFIDEKTKSHKNKNKSKKR